MENIEIWKDIPDYEGLYQVSNLGNVRSLDREVNTCYSSKSNKKGKLLKQCIVRNYLVVCLSKNGVHKNVRVHRLVASVFIPNPEHLPCVNHKNEIKTDNRVENLEWCTVLYNNHYNNRYKRIGDKRKGKYKHTEETKQKMSEAKKGKPKYKHRKPILQYTKDMVFIREWESATQVEKELNIGHSHIAKCCKGKRKSAYNFIWRYKY